jgi:membrane protein DedA with SNARE-associated domain
LSEALSFLGGLGPFLLYLILGIGSALENFFPPIPADTFILLGAFLSAGGRTDAWTVFFVTWLANAGAALLVYRLGYRYGRSFFQMGMGRFVLNRTQLRKIQTFYERWGLPAIFFARFLPGLRAMVPVFAGITHQSFLVVAFPVFVASGIWYGGLVWLGATAGRNLPAISAWVAGANRTLLGLTLLICLLLGFWWIRSRKERGGGEED